MRLLDLKCDKSGGGRGAVKPIQERRSAMTTNNLMLVIKATNDAMALIAETAAPAMAAAKGAVAAAQSAAAPG